MISRLFPPIPFPFPLSSPLLSSPSWLVRSIGTKAPDPPVVNQERIEERELHVEASESYLAYAMSVILGRALPDVRDGLKPVHRRLLYAMHDLGLSPTKPYRKCARVVGEVLGKYHPHGDLSVYDALVRLAQEFSMRDPLISGHGNFGSLDDDPAAAMRYTECRLRPLSSDALLDDLDANTVDFTPTFDAAQDEPSVLPAKIPLLLVNGTSGIAVGIATKIPPHNMNEVVHGLVALINDPNLTDKDLMRYIIAPDFPTGGTVIVDTGLDEAYETGKGHVTMRAKITVEATDGSLISGPEEELVGLGGKEKGKGKKLKKSTEERSGGDGKRLLVITEIPYLTSKADIVQRIAELAESKAIEGISDVRDESDREGLRVVVEVKKGFPEQAVLRQLYEQTKLQSKFSCNMVAVVSGAPVKLSLKAMLENFLNFRCEVVERRARHQAAKAMQRLHLVQGFLLAMSSLDQVVQTIRQATDGASAKAALVDKFNLSPEQADGVLSLTLRRLTSLEVQSLESERNDLSMKIQDLDSLIGSKRAILNLVEQEAQAVALKHGTPRRSVVVDMRSLTSESSASQDSSNLGLDPDPSLPNRPCLITLSSKGYIKRYVYDRNEAGSTKVWGIASAKGSESRLAFASTAFEQESILLITPQGQLHCIPKASSIPESTKPKGSGTALAQVTGASLKEIAALVVIGHDVKKEVREREKEVGSDSSTDQEPLSAPYSFLVIITQNGKIKRIPLTNNMIDGKGKAVSPSGLKATTASDEDPVAAAVLVRDPKDSLLVALSDGHLLALSAESIPLQSRGAKGVKGIQASKAKSTQRRVVSLVSIPKEAQDDEQWIMIVCSSGHSKRIALSELRVQARGGQGLKAMPLKEDEEMVSARLVGASDQALFVSSAEGKGSSSYSSMIVSMEALPVLRRSSRGSSRGTQAILGEGRRLDSALIL